MFVGSPSEFYEAQFVDDKSAGNGDITSSEQPTGFSAPETLRDRDVKPAQPAAAAELTCALATARDRVNLGPSPDSAWIPEGLYPVTEDRPKELDSNLYLYHDVTGWESTLESESQRLELTRSEHEAELLASLEDFIVGLPTSGAHEREDTQTRPNRPQPELGGAGTNHSPINLTDERRRASKRPRPNEDSRVPSLAGSPSSPTSSEDDCILVEPGRSAQESEQILRQFRDQLAQANSTQEILGPLLAAGYKLEQLGRLFRQQGPELVQEILAAGRRLHRNGVIGEELMAWLGHYHKEKACNRIQKFLNSELSRSGARRELCLNLTDVDLGDAPLPPVLLFVPCIQAINLGANDLRQVPELVGCLPHLSRLYLRNNNLTRLPEWFAGLDGLKLLDLSYNCLATVELCLPQSTNLKVIRDDERTIDLVIGPGYGIADQSSLAQNRHSTNPGEHI